MKVEDLFEQDVWHGFSFQTMKVNRAAMKSLRRVEVFAMDAEAKQKLAKLAAKLSTGKLDIGAKLPDVYQREKSLDSLRLHFPLTRQSKEDDIEKIKQALNG